LGRSIFIPNRKDISEINIERKRQKKKKYNEEIKCLKPNMKDGTLYRQNIDFQMAWFERRWNLYVLDNKLVRNETFDHYIQKHKAYEKIISTLFPVKYGKKQLIMYGNGSEFMNVSNFRLKNCAKFSHNDLLKKMKYKKHLQVEMVDESYTSKLCAKCKEEKNIDVNVKFPPKHASRHRYIFCPKCCTGMNRDFNGAKNIYLKNHSQVSIGFNQMSSIHF